MDDLVRAALRKWPHVPHCYAWLALDARGQWFMRDERVQAAGAFPQVKGSRITHDKLLGFIHRNYSRDERGAAYFQNGPQRVYVDLEAAPYVWRLQEPRDGAAASVQVQVQVHAHTGELARVKQCWLDESGRLFLECDLGFGLVHSLDMAVAAQAVEAGVWVPEDMPFAQMPARFGYVLTPRP